MKTQIVLIALTTVVLLFSITCAKKKPKSVCDGYTCYNGGTCSVASCFGLPCAVCDCPAGFCGSTCEVKLVYKQLNTYTGTIICNSVSSNKEITIDSRDTCQSKPDISTFLFLNHDEIIATRTLSDSLAFTIFSIQSFSNPKLRINGNGRISKDSLSFKYKIIDSTGTTIDSCLFAGFRK